PCYTGNSHQQRVAALIRVYLCPSVANSQLPTPNFSTPHWTPRRKIGSKNHLASVRGKRVKRLHGLLLPNFLA
ncbi:hypothetical protein, partial [Pedobacter petrophilus]|uniref:hypothetical protein n=1 Tax=Pedobacter petrophilus TaxID=1908241 RepID=UPI001ADF62BF